MALLENCVATILQRKNLRCIYVATRFYVGEEKLLKLSKDSLIRTLNRFLADGLLEKEGNGRATKYFRK